jgi:hypothetical protein
VGAGLVADDPLGDLEGRRCAVVDVVAACAEEVGVAHHRAEREDGAPVRGVGGDAEGVQKGVGGDALQGALNWCSAAEVLRGFGGAGCADLPDDGSDGVPRPPS